MTLDKDKNKICIVNLKNIWGNFNYKDIIIHRLKARLTDKD